MKFSRKFLIGSLIAATTLLLLCPPSFAVVYNLKADSTTLSMPDGQSVVAWGFGLATDPSVSVPGPILTVPDGDGVLTVNLTNNLQVPVSIVIPGQSASLAPVKFADSRGRMRISSFQAEVAPGATGVYEWSNFQPGSYIYHSGSHVQVQVQMGLYGGVKKDAASGEAYAGVLYDNEVILFYSEIDPELHAAIQDGTYGTAAYPSTINYLPKYYLINGMPFSGTPVTTLADPIVDHPIDPAEVVLVRFFNAGLITHIPIIRNMYMSLVAEDGHQYPQRRELYTATLAAMKTTDALLVPMARGAYPLYDRRFDLVNALSSPGGMLTYLRSGTPTSVDDPDVAADYTINEDSVLNTTLAARPGVLANDLNDPLFDPMTAFLTKNVGHGTLALAADGSFVYTPALNYNGVETFKYRASAADGLVGNLATVTITVVGINDTPLALPDIVTTRKNVAREIVVKANDSDVDSPIALATVAIDVGPRFGTAVVNVDNTITYTPRRNFMGTDIFTYRLTDTGTPLPAMLSLPGKVTVRVLR